MSKRHRQSIKASKRKRREARHPRRRAAYLPYVGVVAVAGALIAALFVVSLGGSGGGNSAAAYPIGYEPPALGEPDAPVEMVVWEDFQCPFCNRFERETFPPLRDQYIDTGKLRFVWRNFENIGFPESHDAMVAAYCAREQDKFWEYHDTLFANARGENQGAFSKFNLRKFADELGLDRAAFDTCIDGSADYDAVAAADKQAGRSQGVNGTPTFFINGFRVVGAQPTITFISIIEDALASSEQE